MAVTPAADLAAKVTAPSTAGHGWELTYTIKITDTGPSEAWQAAVIDHLPAGTAFRNATTGSGSCSRPRAGTRGATCAATSARLAPVPPGASGSRPANAQTIRDQAAVTSVTPDPRPGNNAAAAPTKITR